MIQRRKIITPDDIQRILRGKYGTIMGGGIEQVNYIRNNGIRYRFVLKTGVDEYGAKFYSIIQNDDHEGSGLKCLHGEIDIENKKRFIIMNITKHRGCGIPYEDSGFTKKMIGLITRILKKREPYVNELEVMDLAGTKCRDGRGDFSLSDMFMLKGELPFYMKMGFKPCDEAVAENIHDNMKIVKHGVFHVSDFIKLIDRVYGKGNSELDIYIENTPIEFESEEMPLADAMKFIIDNYCYGLSGFIKRLIKMYNMDSVVGERFWKAI